MNVAIRTLARLAPAFLLSASTLSAQAIQVRDNSSALTETTVRVADRLPEARLSILPAGDVTLAPGLFRERRELTKAYVARLKTEDLLQNYLLEAGMRVEKSYDQMHQGWESPFCQLRGHFLGHWLSSDAHFAATDRDPLFAAREAEVVRELKHCQMLNRGQWIGSIPEKYFEILSEGKEFIWSPQYTLHKTMMGLSDAYRYCGDKEALEIAGHSADWFLSWTDAQIKQGRGNAIYSGECCGMLELWANLFAQTHDPRYLTLASRYAMPDIFKQLLAGEDPLTNNHANASIPWIQGAARLYEVSGDTRYRDVVFAFWKKAVEERGMFATTGNNAGEFWIPPHQFGRFMGSRTQEHCTVYNMIRVAEYLFRWTGDSRYADYIERALYNGILAQQNPNTGMVSYFLPLQPGAKKVWGSETKDFWCCHGTLLQAQAMFEDLIYYRTADGIMVSQYIPSQICCSAAGQKVQIVQKTDAVRDTSDFAATGEATHFRVELTITSEKAGKWILRLRQPKWADGVGVVTVDGVNVPFAVSKDGFLELERDWKDARVTVTFAKHVTREPLPGDNTRFALLDGPVVLAALAGEEPGVADNSVLTPQYEHQYIDNRDWQAGHYLLRTGGRTIALRPLYEIVDENYCVYLSSTK